jgi:PAS domain S-box-containing protein
MSAVPVTRAGTDTDPDRRLLLSRHQVGHLAGVLYLGSAAAVLLTLPLPQPPGVDRTALMAVGSCALGIGALTLLVPWDRLGRRASLVLVPPAIGLIAVADAFGGDLSSSVYGVFFLVTFVWIGIAHGPRCSLAFAPLAVLAYTVSLIVARQDAANAVASGALILPLCVFVGEALGWVEHRYARVREELAESRSRYEALVELSPDAIMVHAAGRLVFVNTAAVWLVRATGAQELLGKEVATIVRMDARGRRARRGAAALRRGTTSTLAQGNVVRMDGTTVEVEVGSAPIALHGEGATQLVVRDISERVRIERELRQSLEDLQRADADRTRLLDHLVGAQDEERRRLAREIHDDAVQAVAVAAMRLDLLERKPLSDDARRLLEGTTGAVQRALERLRHLFFEMRPEALDTDGLAAAIERSARDLCDDGPLDVRVRSDLVGEPPDAIQDVAYRIAQEALTNVRRHADASSVSIDLFELDGELLMRIADDGAGFDADQAAPESDHIGLTAMRERAELAGGRISIQSRRGRGCVIECWLPLGGAVTGGRQSRRATE